MNIKELDLVQHKDLSDTRDRNILQKQTRDQIETIH